MTIPLTPAELAEMQPKPDRVWIANKPEQRLSIAFNRLLDDTLLRPCYFVANQDADGGGRTDNQRVRDINRGIDYGQLDWEAEQGPPHLFRRIELKRGKNTTTDKQGKTIDLCTACGAPPIVAWTLAEAIDGMLWAGFRFAATLPVRLAYWQAQLEGWDREAEAKLAGAVPKKKSRPRKVEPRSTASKGMVRRMTTKGIMF